jgi:hypothetical protein
MFAIVWGRARRGGYCWRALWEAPVTMRSFRTAVFREEINVELSIFRSATDSEAPRYYFGRLYSGSCEPLSPPANYAGGWLTYDADGAVTQERYWTCPRPPQPARATPKPGFAIECAKSLTSP